MLIPVGSINNDTKSSPHKMMSLHSLFPKERDHIPPSQKDYTLIFFYFLEIYLLLFHIS